MAGATARTMLIAAAAKAWHLDPAECHAMNGTVVNRQGRVLTYGELADAAAKLPVPKDVKLKTQERFPDHRQIASPASTRRAKSTAAPSSAST